MFGTRKMDVSVNIKIDGNTYQAVRNTNATILSVALVASGTILLKGVGKCTVSGVQALMNRRKQKKASQ